MANNASEDVIFGEVEWHDSPDQTTSQGEHAVHQQSNSASEDIICQEVRSHDSLDQTRDGDEDNNVNQRPRRKWSQVPGNVEDLEEYTAFPHHIYPRKSMSGGRRTRAYRFVAACVEFSIDLCSAAREQTTLHYRKGREEFYHRLTEHRRRKVCTRAEPNDVAILPSKKPEVTERNQVESGLLRLPVELRMQIYECIYTPAATIDISDIPSGMTMFRLQAHILEASLHDPSCHIKESSCLCFVSRVGFNLPLTCRQLHSETIHYLYSTNAFRFASNRLIFSLPSTIPVKHLQCITSLDLTFEVDRIFESSHLLRLLQKKHLHHMAWSERRGCNEYIEFWHFLRTTITQLRSLVVTFHRMGSRDNDKALEQRICEWFLAPLSQRGEGGVKSQWSPELKHFEVRLGTFWFLHDDPEDTSFIDAYKGGDAPFVLRRECDCEHDFRYCILFHLPD